MPGLIGRRFVRVGAPRAAPGARSSHRRILFLIAQAAPSLADGGDGLGAQSPPVWAASVWGQHPREPPHRVAAPLFPSFAVSRFPFRTNKGPERIRGRSSFVFKAPAVPIVGF